MKNYILYATLLHSDYADKISLWLLKQGYGVDNHSINKKITEMNDGCIGCLSVFKVKTEEPNRRDFFKKIKEGINDIDIKYFSLIVEDDMGSCNWDAGNIKLSENKLSVDTGSPYRSAP